MSQPPQGPYGPPDPHQWQQTGPMQPYGQQPAPYGYQPPPQPYYYLPPPTSGLAVASLVFALVGLLFGWCLFGAPSILAVIFGHLANREIRHGVAGGQGLATAGLVLGYIIVGPAVFVTILVVTGAAAGA